MNELSSTQGRGNPYMISSKHVFLSLIRFWNLWIQRQERLFSASVLSPHRTSRNASFPSRKFSTAPFNKLQPKVQKFVEEKARICQPSQIHVCDGSQAEGKQLLDQMQKDGQVIPLDKYENW